MTALVVTHSLGKNPSCSLGPSWNGRMNLKEAALCHHSQLCANWYLKLQGNLRLSPSRRFLRPRPAPRTLLLYCSHQLEKLVEA